MADTDGNRPPLWEYEIREGHPEGPVSEGSLRALHESGLLSGSSHVRRAGDRGWVHYSALFKKGGPAAQQKEASHEEALFSPTFSGAAPAGALGDFAAAMTAPGAPFEGAPISRNGYRWAPSWPVIVVVWGLVIFLWMKAFDGWRPVLHAPPAKEVVRRNVTDGINSIWQYLMTVETIVQQRRPKGLVSEQQVAAAGKTESVQISDVAIKLVFMNERVRDAAIAIRFSDNVHETLRGRVVTLRALNGGRTGGVHWSCDNGTIDDWWVPSLGEGVRASDVKAPWSAVETCNAVIQRRNTL